MSQVKRGLQLADHQQQQPRELWDWDWDNDDDDGDLNDLPVYKRENNMDETVVWNGL